MTFMDILINIVMTLYCSLVSFCGFILWYSVAKCTIDFPWWQYLLGYTMFILMALVPLGGIVHIWCEKEYVK